MKIYIPSTVSGNRNWFEIGSKPDSTKDLQCMSAWCILNFTWSVKHVPAIMGRKFEEVDGCRLRCRSRYLTTVQNYEILPKLALVFQIVNSKGFSLVIFASHFEAHEDYVSSETNLTLKMKILGQCISWFTRRMRNVCATVGILVHHLRAHLVGRFSHGSNGTPNNASKNFSENLAIFVKTSIQRIFRFPSFCIIFAFQNLCNFISNRYAARILYPVGNIYYYYLHRLVYVLTMNEALGNFGSNVQTEIAVERIISHVNIFLDMVDIHQEEPLSNYEATVFLMYHVSQLLTKCCLFLLLLIALNVANIPYFVFHCMAYYWYYMIHLLSNEASLE
ncbi:hypothetical protein AVEN_67105-1 [Araneus ventricosus]|uniref:Uncharacterized protein n=1 Tax=Araneus ventricosus TaxID=182803 RepID=A0A4Y2FT97_ARAVE|nr:hypothetical protein AVEN_67105-1 [Araneus ventricosus]